MKTETRVYLVNLLDTRKDADFYLNCSDEDFMEEAEYQGLVHSVEYFQNLWDLNRVPSQAEHYLRIINVPE